MSMFGTLRGLQGGGKYYANAVALDGSSYVSRTAALTGGTTSKVGTLSFAFRRTTTGTEQLMGAGTGNTHLMQFNGSDKLVLYLAGSSVNVLAVTSSAAFTDTAWHTAQISWDLTNSSNRAVKIDNATDSASWGTYTNTAADYTKADWFIGSNSFQHFTGDLADFYFNQSERVDLAASNPFLDANGKPASLGIDGSIPTGTSPLICLNKGFATWQTNSGTGGDFTETGTITEAATSPSD